MGHDHFHGNGPYGRIPTRKEPIRTFRLRLTCRVIKFLPLCYERERGFSTSRPFLHLNVRIGRSKRMRYFLEVNRNKEKKKSESQASSYPLIQRYWFIYRL